MQEVGFTLALPLVDIDAELQVVVGHAKLAS